MGEDTRKVEYDAMDDGVRNDADVEALYRRYQRGEITLRNMAAELGLVYRELYALLEEKGLPF